MLRLAPSFCDMIIENPRKSAFALLFFFCYQAINIYMNQDWGFLPTSTFLANAH